MGQRSALCPYPDCKDSGLPWLGEIPAHWEMVRTKYLFRERSEKGFPNETLLAATQTKGVVPKEHYENRTVVALNDLHLLKLVRVGDFVISLRSFQGGIEYAHYQGIISPAYTVLQPSQRAHPGFVRWLLKSEPYIDNLKVFVTGIRQGQNIDYERLSRSLLPLPNEGEQEAISAFLTNADRRINRLIRAKRRLIDLLSEQKQAIIHRAVTRGLDPTVRLKDSGVEWLGEVPEHWEIRRAKDVCSAIIDCKNRTPMIVENGDYVVIRTSNVKNGKLDLSSPTLTDESNYREWTRRGAPRKGDVFFTREAPAGEACLVPSNDNLCMGQRMMYFRLDPEVMHPDFLVASIYGPVVRRYIDAACNGSTVGHLRLGQVYAIPLLWCPPSEQREIMQKISAESLWIDRAVDRTQREIDLIREYRTRLIADVVTGKLDVRGVELPVLDEPMPLYDLDTADEANQDEMLAAAEDEVIYAVD